MKNVYLDWHDTEELLSHLIFKLNTPYDLILAISRGGIIPGGMIAEALDMRDLLTTTVSFPEDPTRGTALGWPKFIQFPPDALIDGRKVLIVDNLWSKGRTIMAVKGRVETAGGYPDVAVLHWKKTRNLFPEDEPDFYGEETADFIHYPWQRIDDSDYRIKAFPEMPLS